jgi:thioredoxin reductase
MEYDVVIVGGGPAGLAAALTLGRARKRVLLCDSGPPRNAAAVHVQNFVTRDGIPPAEFRGIAREQLRPYINVDVRDERARHIAGEVGAFAVRLDTDSVRARRVLLCTGMIDELPDTEGLRELWGKSIFQCPYCHGWEVQDQRFAYLASSSERSSFALFLRGWTSDVVLLTNGEFAIAGEIRQKLEAGQVRVEERSIQRLVARGERLAHIEFTDGARVDRDVLFVHPPQRQVDLVRALGIALDDKGFVRVDETTAETAVRGIYAAGDLTTPAQGALLAAAAGTRAAAMLNHALTEEMAIAGALAEARS